jgi:hypothetical protein
MPGCNTLPCGVAGIGEGAVRHHDLEETFAADGEVECVAGGQERALRHHPRGADGAHTAAEFDADRQDVALGRGLRAHAADVLVEQVLEFGALALVAGRAHVGDVVGDDLDVEFLGHHAGRRGMERSHGLSP